MRDRSLAGVIFAISLACLAIFVVNLVYRVATNDREWFGFQPVTQEPCR